ncbi:hypothetical protein F4779DRAFT_640480 [Xylariaceae sp. FL0662B]|nr:hypothetical protein F4779DRAFT_640480 [Xylariaceae sp. FL0662B]
MVGNWTASISPPLSIQTPGPDQVSNHHRRHHHLLARAKPFCNSPISYLYLPGATNIPHHHQMVTPAATTYLSRTAVIGGTPTPPVDDPVACVLLSLFAASAGAHLAILRRGRARAKKKKKKKHRRDLRFFYLCGTLLVALCVLRAAALIVRVVWASTPAAGRGVAVAANITTQTGSVLVFVLNLVFAHRVLRAYLPKLGRGRGRAREAGRAAFAFLLVCVAGCLIATITASAQSFFASDARVRHRDHVVLLVAGTYLAALAFLPVPIVALPALLTPRGEFPVEKFGSGRWRTKVGLLLFTSLIATLGAGFRAGATFDTRPADRPAWFHGRAAYYCFNYVTDLVISTAYLLARCDRRFLVVSGGARKHDHPSHDQESAPGAGADNGENGGGDNGDGEDDNQEDKEKKATMTEPETTGREKGADTTPDSSDHNDSSGSGGSGSSNKSDSSDSHSNGNSNGNGSSSNKSSSRSSRTTANTDNDNNEENHTSPTLTAAAAPTSSTTTSSIGSTTSSRRTGTSSATSSTDVEAYYTATTPGGFLRVLDKIQQIRASVSSSGSSLRRPSLPPISLVISPPKPTLLPLSRAPPRLELEWLGDGTLTKLDFDWSREWEVLSHLLMHELLQKTLPPSFEDRSTSLQRCDYWVSFRRQTL